MRPSITGYIIRPLNDYMHAPDPPTAFEFFLQPTFHSYDVMPKNPPTASSTVNAV